MSAVFDLERIGAAFAEAAIDPCRWDAAMEVAATVAGGFGAALFPIKGRLPNVPISASMQESFDVYVRDGWIHRDERYRGLNAMARTGVVTDLDFVTPDEIARHPYYQDFLGRFRLRWFVGVKVEAVDDLWCLSIQRSTEQGPFSSTEINQLAALSRRLASSAALARALGFARAEAALDAFSAAGSPILLLDRHSEVLRINEATERLLGRDLQVCGRRIVSIDRNATAALDGALRALLWTRVPSALMPPVRLPRTSGSSPLLAYPLRLSGVSASALAPCQAIIAIVDPDVRPRPPEATLRFCFGLTSAEAKVAKAVAAGEMLETVADELEISYATARNQLKAVFQKTGVHRQAELVTLLARLSSAPQL
jgi:DNA-binding CsgD family transcriptional regulator/PAS domain-containing protein